MIGEPAGSTLIGSRNVADEKIDRLGEGGLDLSQLWLALVEGWRWIFATVILFGLIGTGYAFLVTPTFRADALIQVEDKTATLPGLADLTDILGSESSAQSEMEIVRSRMVLGTTIDQLRLDILVAPWPEFIATRIARIFKNLPREAGAAQSGTTTNWGEDNGYIHDALNAIRGPQPINANRLFAGWNDNNWRIQVDQFEVPRTLLNKELTLQTQGSELFELQLEDATILRGTVGQEARSTDGQVVLRLAELRAPPDGRFILVRQHRVTAMRELMRNLSVAEAGKGTGILKMTLTGPDPERAEKILDAITNTYVLQNMRRQAEQAEKSLDFLHTQVPLTRDQLDKAEQRLNAYRKERESVDLSLEAKAVLDQQIALEVQLNQLRVKESELRQLYAVVHPAFQTLKEQGANLLQEKKRLDAIVKGLPETQEKIFRLMRDVEINKEIYLQLVSREQELNVIKAGSLGNVRILDHAEADPTPIAPRKQLIAVLSILSGGFFGVCGVLVRESFKRRLENPALLEKMGFNVYATLPSSSKEANYAKQRLQRISRLRRGKSAKDTAWWPVLAATDPEDNTVEAIRSLRTSLHFAMLEEKNKVVMISGPTPGVGKSFVSANLGVVLAQSGQRVLLIDGDIRNGHLHEFFGGEGDAGLSHYLSGQAPQESVIRRTHIEGLDFVSRGIIAPNPSELLMHPRLQALLDAAGTKYDAVLIDTPPILAVTDAAIVGRAAGASLIVVRFGLNTLEEVDLTFRRFERDGIKLEGCIFNCFEARSSGAYGYKYGYGYGIGSRHR